MNKKFIAAGWIVALLAVGTVFTINGGFAGWLVASQPNSTTQQPSEQPTQTVTQPSEPTAPQNQAPIAEFSFYPSPGKTNQKVFFNANTSSDSDGSIVSYSWNFGDGKTASGVNAENNYTAAGNYSVQLTVTDDGGASSSATKIVSIIQATPNQIPIASFTYSPTSPTTATNISFDGSSSKDSDGLITTWLWNFGDGTGGNGKLVTKKFSIAKTYVVSLTVVDNAGASKTTSKNVTVTAANKNPTASFTYSPTSPKVGTSIRFDGSASTDSDGTIQKWAWSFGDTATASGKIAYKTYSAAKTYNVTLAVTDNLGAIGKITKQIKVT